MTCEHDRGVTASGVRGGEAAAGRGAAAVPGAPGGNAAVAHGTGRERSPRTLPVSGEQLPLAVDRHLGANRLRVRDVRPWQPPGPAPLDSEP